MQRPRCVVFGDGTRAPSFGLRTLRALELAGFSPVDLSGAPLSALDALLPRGPLWLVRAGAWPAFGNARQGLVPPATASGAPLCALGAVLPTPDEPGDTDQAEARAWATILRECGGDLNRALRRSSPCQFPPLASVYLDAVLAPRVSAQCARGATLHEALQHGSRGVRVVRYAPLDVYDCAQLRVAQVVTSLQRGGAERLALELASELPRIGVRSRVYSVYSPTRTPFATPHGALDLARGAPAAETREHRFSRLARELGAWGADLVHATCSTAWTSLA
ncbi:MAG: hypothetical protein QM756_25340 [Polyangiaceae bacterium]